MPSLKIGRVTARLPIIQGGMAVRVSMAPLASAVASAGGIGVIAGSGLAVDELRAEIREAKAATDGIIGVNVMVAVRNFADLVKAAIEEGIDLVIAGAGFSRDVFAWTRDAGVPMVPIVGSERVAAALRAVRRLGGRRRGHRRRRPPRHGRAGATSCCRAS